ncbi:uncharacterized protein K452DRAFT_301889 [Aplosporella prunicola CBS 121167]|uniref:Exoribonuclease phosphorolytic domain-containing protein n=1 Tax=Aplosporella prunicola CBS 121167 TaxID=1176127 RepID=A0A6A6B299_9PEZI|nr:uncharacterized protein K452DRAFT_301889 [Aplosporella prunicola CBS 121167]KAF2137493.1 hypothetical protein K452DRAFT_301889 [Aplosporella prunicola CBS 121167]
MPAIQASLSDLHRADGSATYTQDGYSVLGAVNGPIEVQRRDELPEEAAIEVNVRPAIGVGSPKERHLETIIHSTLRHIVLVRNFPRTLIQLTLQVLSMPEGDPGAERSASSSISLLPALLNSSVLTLLSANIPLRSTFTAVLLCVSPDASIIASPNPKQLAAASSTHVFAFSGARDLLLAESEGACDMDTWNALHDTAQRLCCNVETAEGETGMEVDVPADNLLARVKEAVRQKIERDQAWKEAS